MQAFCVLSQMFDCMYQTATVPVLLLHLSCSILGSNAGRQQALTLLYKLCDFICKRDLQHTQLVSRCCDVASAVIAHVHRAQLCRLFPVVAVTNGNASTLCNVFQEA